MAGLSGAGRRTMTACPQAIAAWASAGAADINTLPRAQLHYGALKAAWRMGVMGVRPSSGVKVANECSTNAG